MTPGRFRTTRQFWSYSGLAIVTRIMEDHGGALKLFDATERPGARAVLNLPRLKVAEPAASIETAAE